MIVVELAFEATPDRMSARPAHRALLETLHAEGSLQAAGPWEDDSGALLVFTSDRQEVERLLASDPYYSTPGVAIVAVREWTPIVGAGSAASAVRRGQ